MSKKKLKNVSATEDETSSIFFPKCQAPIKSRRGATAQKNQDI